MGNPAISFLLAFLGTGIIIYGSIPLLLRPWKASVNQHWTERARLLWSARRATSETLVICLGSPIAGWFLFRKGMEPCPFGALMGGSFLGFVVGFYPFSKAVNPEINVKAYVRRELMALSGIGVMFGIYFWLYWTMSSHLDRGDWVRLAVGIVALTLLFTGKWMRWILDAGENDPLLARLHLIVDSASKETGIPVRRAWIADVPVANAMALNLIGELMFTRRLMLQLDDEEIAAICHHELAHLAEPRALKLARLIGGFSWLPFAFIHPMERVMGTLAYSAACFGMLLIRQLQRTVARRMEKRADAAAIASGPSPAIYARALEKLYEVNLVPAVINSKQVFHPSLYDRMLAAGVQPEYPRPLPPSKNTHWVVWSVAGIPLALVVVRGILVWRDYGK